eukprot:gb/GECH01008420.1/.p1 GENE.gb/GECH01008420.1/~~gb/GECH01008420.1/.p1  ORF type:complete len:431 (+),score=102.26 gb/GECH01008420.1/:1-1293(+)
MKLNHHSYSSSSFYYYHRYISLVLLLLLSLTWSIQARNFFLWSDKSGQQVVVMDDGSVKPVEYIWAGHAAWNDAHGVSQAIHNAIGAHKIPYIQSYQYGDNGISWTGDLYKAVEFDAAIAKAIGNSFALVNVETEWDGGQAENLITTHQGQENMRERIQQYRHYAPNTELLSTPGLWKPDHFYGFFDSLDSQMDHRGDILHMASDQSHCTSRLYGGNFADGRGFNSAQGIGHYVVRDMKRTQHLWGSSSGSGRYFVTGDLAVTNCGWGVDGQADIFRRLVDNFNFLYEQGWRGAVIRNEAPSKAERYMGVKNEGGFVWSHHSRVKSEIDRGLNLARQIMRSGGPQTPGSSLQPELRVSLNKEASNGGWLQLKVEPDAAKRVQVEMNHGWQDMQYQWYGEWTRGGSFPAHQPIHIRLVDYSGRSKTFTGSR